MTPEAVQQLLDRYVSEELSRGEFVALWQTLSQEEHRGLWEQQLDQLFRTGEYDELADPVQQQAMLRKILLGTTELAPVRRMSSKRTWWAAASIAIILAVCGYLWFASEKQSLDISRKTTPSRDAAPGKNGAVLTLADGSQVVLDSMKNGLVATQNGTKVTLHNNEISYAPENADKKEIVYNTLSTPRGRMFHVQLPDGTEVWLNAASSIRYPIAFTGAERKVAISGEAYFEVAKNPKLPFVVDVDKKIKVQVIGTHFNINAYSDEPKISTTLLEGSVKVVNEEEAVILTPGQQAQVTGAQMKVINGVDLSVSIAWKDGKFRFNHTPLNEILRQFARWYDVEIIYEGKVPDFVLSGGIKRYFTLSEALLTLTEMGLRYRIEGKQLIVMN